MLPGHDRQDPFLRLVMAFLVSYRRHSARGYMTDLRAWADWCAPHGRPPVRRPPPPRRRLGPLGSNPNPSHEQDGRWLQPQSPDVCPRFRSSTTTASASTSSPSPPSPTSRRPKVSDDSSTTALSTQELLALLDVADADSPRSSALIHLLAYNGLRIDEALSANVGDYRYQHGHRVLRIVRKGGKTSTEPLAAPVVRALDTYLTDRTTGPYSPATTATPPKPAPPNKITRWPKQIQHREQVVVTGG